MKQQAGCFWRQGLVPLFLLSGIGANCLADSVPAVDVNPATEGDSVSFLLQTNGMFGWSFYVMEPITVTGVGWYDEGLDGLIYSHEIGIWQNLQGQVHPLASARVEAGTNAPLNGPWRMAQFSTPISLQPYGYSVGYTIAGTYFTESPDVVRFLFNSGGTPGPNFLPADSRIRINAPSWSSGGGFQAPNTSGLSSGVMAGPMLFIVAPDYNQPPLLRLDKVSGFVYASWPLWATNFVLETSPSLATSASWMPFTNSTNARGFALIGTNGFGTTAFFRLRKE
jgi:hypothetical protein